VDGGTHMDGFKTSLTRSAFDQSCLDVL
jgi:hypothetical protein